MKADWITPWFQAATLPSKWDVCGIVVPSLSVWHVFVLQNIGNRYVCKQDGADRDDAASMLLLAGLDFEGGRKLWHDPDYRAREMAAIHKRLVGLDWLTLHGACEEYARVCTRCASRWQKGGSRPAGVAEAWHLVSIMSNNDPARIESAWNASYAVGCALFDSVLERAGDTSVMSARAQEMEDNWSEYEKEST